MDNKKYIPVVELSLDDCVIDELKVNDTEGNDHHLTITDDKDNFIAEISKKTSLGRALTNRRNKDNYILSLGNRYIEEDFYGNIMKDGTEKQREFLEDFALCNELYYNDKTQAHDDDCQTGILDKIVVKENEPYLILTTNYEGETYYVSDGEDWTITNERQTFYTFKGGTFGRKRYHGLDEYEDNPCGGPWW